VFAGNGFVTKSCLRRALLALCWLLASSPAHAADVRITLPLEGNYRAGRFMPVHVTASGVRGETLTLAARGAVPVAVTAYGGNINVIVPWLAVRDSLNDPSWSDGSGGHPLELKVRAASDGEKLVALAGEDAAAARLLFPNETVLAIRLDASQPLLVPTVAWEALDGLILDPASAARVEESQLRAMLAAGTTVAVRTIRRPAGRWPWTHEGELWVVRNFPLGPAGTIEPDAYRPTYNWVRGWPADFRRRAVLAGAVGGILVLAASMWRSRRAAVAVIGINAVVLGLWLAWAARQTPVLQLSGRVLVQGESLWQEDHWTWFSPLTAADVAMPAETLTKPIFASAHQIESSGIRWGWSDETRSGQYGCHLDPRTSMAFLKREVMVQYAIPDLTPGRSALATMVRELYLRPGDQLLGETTDASDQVTVVVRAKSR
jgi:hypothetical protein